MTPIILAKAFAVQLPLNFANRPFKTKYIDEETPMFARWMAFGTRSDGTTDICSGDTDVFECVPRDIAERIIAARHDFIDVIMRELNG